MGGTGPLTSSESEQPEPEAGIEGDAPRDANRVGRLAFLAAASEVLASSLDLSETLERIVRIAVPELADTCSIELLENGQLQMAAIADADADTELVLREHASDSGYADRAGYPPRLVIESGRPMLVPEVPEAVYRRFARDPEHLAFLLSRRAGTGMCVPLMVRGVPFGTLSCARLAGKPAYTQDDLHLAVDLAQRAAFAIDAARQFRAAQTELEARRLSEAKHHFLADVTRAVASEHDYEASLRMLASMSVPFLGDLCMIDAAEGSSIRRIAAFHHDPEAQLLVDELERKYAPSPNGRHPAVRAINTGEPAFAAEMSEEFLRATTRDDRHYSLVRQLGFTSYVCVPLMARKRVLGAFTIVSCSPDRRYTEDDVHLVEEVAARTAMVLDTSRLLAGLTTVAKDLQRALLPAALPTIPNIEIHAGYRAGAEGVEVGGDFYDAFSTERGTWAVVVGDVCGKGPLAAGLTGLVRHTLRAVVPSSPDTVETMRRVNQRLLEETDDRFCTLVYAELVVRDDGVDLWAICAGHPYPLVRRADGSIETVKCTGTLLGTLPEIDLAEPELVQLGPGDVLLLFTDGITEARRGTAVFGPEGVIEALASATPDARGAVEAVFEAVDEFTDGDTRDDIALLAIGVPGLPGPS